MIKKGYLFSRLFKKTLKLTAFIGVMSIILSGTGGASVVLTQKIVDQLVTATTIQTIIPIIAALFLIKVSEISIRGLKNYYENKLQLDTKNRLDKIIIDIIKPETITQIESATYRNDINLVKNSVSYFSRFINVNLAVFQSIVQLMIYSYIIFIYNWYVLIIIYLLSVPKFFFEQKVVKFREKNNQDTNELQRRTYVINSYLTLPDAQKDILIFSMRNLLESKWRRLLESYTKLKLKYIKKETVFKFITDLPSLVQFIGIQLYLVSSVINKSVSIGEYVSLMVAVSAVEGTFKSLSINFGNYKEFSIAWRRLTSFILQYNLTKPPDEKIAIQKIESICIRNLYFRYPNHNNYQLRNINLELNTGETLVLIGENGSGKSTLGKIIIGLHNVCSNKVEINGLDLNDIDRRSYFKRISVVNQDYVKFPLTLYENITVQDSELADPLFEFSNCSIIPKEIIEQPHIILGNEFANSRQLSGGQWQRVAIARSCYKESDVLLLDEATSALDPETESSFINYILKNRRDKITIIVTHRLAIATHATKLILLDKGEIVGSGTHDELYRNNHKYKKMWDEQIGLIEAVVP